MTPSNESLRERARELHLYGLLAYWDELGESDEAWIRRLVEWEETERCRRSLERRLGTARIGRFKSMVDFDWSWPASCDREAVEDVLNLSFMNDCGNAVLLGPNGIGKSTIARNAAYNAVLAGHNVRFVTASQMLNQLSTQDGATAMERKLKAYAAPHLLVIDELGYLSYGNRHADLLFEVVSRRYDTRSTLVTTNKPFSEWGDVFPNASCVVTLVDRLVHRCEVINLEGESYRLKEARERTAQKKAERRTRKARRKPKP